MLSHINIPDLIKDPQKNLLAHDRRFAQVKVPSNLYQHMNMRFTRIPSFLALTANILPILSSARYTILEPIPASQRTLLNTAFNNAILLAAVAARPPLRRLGHGQRKRTYNKYSAKTTPRPCRRFTTTSWAENRIRVMSRLLKSLSTSMIRGVNVKRIPRAL